MASKAKYSTCCRCNLSSPKPEHTTGGSGRHGAQQGCVAWWGGAVQNADGLGGLEAKGPLSLPEYRGQLLWIYIASMSKRRSMQTDGGTKSAVDLQFNCRMESTCRSWRLNNVPTLIFLANAVYPRRLREQKACFAGRDDVLSCQNLPRPFSQDASHSNDEQVVCLCFEFKQKCLQSILFFK